MRIDYTTSGLRKSEMALHFHNFCFEHPFKHAGRTRQGPSNHRTLFWEIDAKHSHALFHLSHPFRSYHVVAKVCSCSGVPLEHIQSLPELHLPLPWSFWTHGPILSLIVVIQMMRQRKPGMWSMGHFPNALPRSKDIQIMLFR